MAKTTIAIYDKQQVDDLIGGFSPDITDLKERMTDAETEIESINDSLDGLAEVARSGDYDDLLNKPIIPPGAVLYPDTGQNTDGAITQKGTTDALALKANITDLPSSAELVPDYSQATTGQILTRTPTGTGWTTPAAGITITDMQTYYQITY